MVVQVFVSYICKKSADKAQTADAVLHNGVRGALHKAVFAPLIDHLAHHSVQANGIGCSVSRNNLPRSNLIDNRRDKSRLVSHRLHKVVEECGNRGLAVCTRNAHHLQFVRWVTVEGRGDNAHCHIGIFDHNKGAVGIGNLGWYMLAYNRNGTALYRLSDKVVSIDRCTCNGKETASLAYGARVVGQPCDLYLVTARQSGVCNTS